MDQEYNVITITDEDGVEYELEVLATVTWQGSEYYALAPLDAAEDEDLEVSILKAVEENGEPMLIAVEDEEELETVFDLLMDDMLEEDED
ncbi:MAG: DUF1292 domain-containing protein [Oscillospiraceae bacterium]|nr:DUF1292 domain-containing protein [Oscillospiraceae bacterium]